MKKSPSHSGQQPVAESRRPRPSSKPARSTKATKDPVARAIIDGIKRLKTRPKPITWKALADKIGCSTTKVQFWKEGTRKILKEDAITLSLLDHTLNEDPSVRAKLWLDACGHPVDLGTAKALVSERTRLTTNIDDALKRVRALAESKGLAKADFDMALSCYLGQKRLIEDLDAWLVETNGIGTSAFFWRWDEKLHKRFDQQQTKNLIKYLITALRFDKDGRHLDAAEGEVSTPGRWRPEGMRPELIVMFLIQVNVDENEWPATKERLAEVERSFKDALALGSAETQRLVFLYATKKFPHPSDCLVSTCPGRSFAFLLSESNKLMAKVLNSKVEEMRDAPWSWCGQVILIDGEESVKKEYLRPRDVHLEYGVLMPSPDTWKQLNDVNQSVTNQ